MTNNKEKGGYGERLAEAALMEKGYRIRARNFRCRLGEIDIIAEKDATVVFIEVKYRRGTAHGYPSEAVTPYKQLRIRRSAEYYIYKNGLRDTDFRFDVIQILEVGQQTELEHIVNAF